MHVQAPRYFDDSLKQRTLPYKWRSVGNPFKFLNDVGILPMMEFIYKGNNVIDLAQELNIGVTLLTTWLENEGHLAAIEEAERVSAEGYLAEGHRLLRTAGTDFDLKKAKEMIAHARFMAAKKDRTKYGSDDRKAPGQGVTFIINMDKDKPEKTVVIEQEAPKPTRERLVLDFTPEEQRQLGTLPDIGPFVEPFTGVDLDSTQPPSYIKDKSCK